MSKPKKVEREDPPASRAAERTHAGVITAEYDYTNELRLRVHNTAQVGAGSRSIAGMPGCYRAFRGT